MNKLLWKTGLGISANSLKTSPRKFVATRLKFIFPEAEISPGDSGNLTAESGSAYFILILYPPDFFYPLQFAAYCFIDLKAEVTMYTYELLETGCYYLIKEKEDSKVKMIQVAVESDHCLYIQHFDNPAETCWKMKKDTLADIIECLSDETVQAWKQHYNIPSEDIFFEDEDE